LPLLIVVYILLGTNMQAIVPETWSVLQFVNVREMIQGTGILMAHFSKPHLHIL